MAPKPKAIAMTPPAVSRGGRKSNIDPEVVAVMVPIIEGGDYAGVPDADTESGALEYPAESGSDKARAKARNAANSAAVRHKKAIVNSPDNDFDKPALLKTRVWEVRENVFTWAVGPKSISDGEDDDS